MNRMIQDPGFEARLTPLGQFWNSGGLPIIVDDVLIGAIGVGGMPPAAANRVLVKCRMSVVRCPMNLSKNPLTQSDEKVWARPIWSSGQ